MRDEQMRPPRVGQTFDQIEAKLQTHRLAMHAPARPGLRRSARGRRLCRGAAPPHPRANPGSIRTAARSPAARIAGAPPARVRTAACRDSTTGRSCPKRCQFAFSRPSAADCTRPLMGFGVNEYHPSMAQSLKTKYLLTRPWRRAPRCRCCSAVLPITSTGSRPPTSISSLIRRSSKDWKANWRRGPTA